MKKITVILAVAISVSLIVLSLILPVNYSLSRAAAAHTRAILLADGAGLPPNPPATFQKP